MMNRRRLRQEPEADEQPRRHEQQPPPFVPPEHEGKFKRRALGTGPVADDLNAEAATKAIKETDGLMRGPVQSNPSGGDRPGEKDPLAFAKLHGVTKDQLATLDGLVIRARFKPTEATVGRIEWIMKRLVAEQYLTPRGLACFLYSMGVRFMWVRQPTSRVTRKPKNPNDASKQWFELPFYGTEDDYLKAMRKTTIQAAFDSLPDQDENE
jgi:hypothetical protein